MARLKVYAELGSEGGCILYTFDPPGLLSCGDSLDEAMAAAPREAARKRDLEPVRSEEVPGFLAILEHQRKTLWALKDRLPAEAYGFKSLPRRMTIKEQLTHIAACDRWYLSRYWRDLPTLRWSKDVWDKLVLNREPALERLGHLSLEDRAAARTTGGQVWTARKLFRRFMYHEKFHRDTIERDLALFLRGTS
ncbi:MAG: DinB family protein [Bacillota bacterium]